jgi:alkanesulfonate monooxygenase SsuD/methylene tetrahydromethanopterin reductase-like flavin-dependent oxidoreductase (luciferase family)
MKVGFFTDLRNPRPWERPSPEHYARSLELIEEAERLGGAYVFLGEHHLSPDGYIPQPLTFAAAIAARTTQIRIGTEVLLASIRHPLHIAEEAAVIDVLSNGRVELGLGSGYVPKEFDAFGVDRASRFTLLDRAVTEVRRLLADVVTPRPVQAEIPIWCGYNFPVGARRAGRMGTNLMSLVPWAVEPYLEGLAEGGYDPGRARMGGLLDLIVSDDPERTRSLAQPHIECQAAAYAEFFAEVDRYEGREPAPPLGGSGALDSYQILTPEDAITSIKERTQGMPVEFVTPWLSIGGMPDELAVEHITLTMTKVAPALAD